MDKTARTKIQGINQALLAATSSIKLAKRLLTDLEQQSGPSPRDLPGEIGSYEGHFLVTDSGERYPIPENYASKSKLVYGDKLKRIVQEDGVEIFKQIERVRRQEVAGILARKEGKWHVISASGSYEVLPSAVKFWDGKEGEEAVAIIPQDEKRVPFAALKEILREGPPSEKVSVESQASSDEPASAEENTSVAEPAKETARKPRHEAKQPLVGGSTVGEPQLPASHEAVPATSPEAHGTSEEDLR